VKVNNGSLAIDVEGNQLATLLELAHDGGRMTGLVTNGSVTSPTSAAFYAHTLAQDDRGEIARQLVKAKLDLVLGGGLADFEANESHAEDGDGRDLVGDLVHAGYEVVHALEELEDIPRWRRPKLVGLFADAELPFAGKIESPDDQPTLPVMVRRAIELLQYNRGGYLLVVDAALARKAAAEGDAEQRIAETVELDEAIAEALRYAGAKSMILVCSDVAIPPAAAPIPAPPANSAAVAEPSLSDATPTTSEAPPSNDQQLAVTPPPTDETPSLQQAAAAPSPNETISPSPAGVAGSSPAKEDGTAADVVAFGTGLGANALHGVAESTVIFDIIRDNL
jgi:alkaline phosphatase